MASWKKIFSNSSGAVLLVPVVIVSALANLVVLASYHSNWRIGIDSATRIQRGVALRSDQSAIQVISRIFQNGGFQLDNNYAPTKILPVTGGPAYPPGFQLAPDNKSATWTVCAPDQLKTNELNTLYLTGSTDYVFGANGTCSGAGRHTVTKVEFLGITAYPFKVGVRASTSVPGMTNQPPVVVEALVSVATPAPTCTLESFSWHDLVYGQSMQPSFHIYGIATVSNMVPIYTDPTTPGHGMSIPGYYKVYPLDGTQTRWETPTFYPESSGYLVAAVAGLSGAGATCTGTAPFRVLPRTVMMVSTNSMSGPVPQVEVGGNVNVTVWFAGPWTAVKLRIWAKQASLTTFDLDTILNPIGTSPRVVTIHPTALGQGYVYGAIVGQDGIGEDEWDPGVPGLGPATGTGNMGVTVYPSAPLYGIYMVIASTTPWASPPTPFGCGAYTLPQTSPTNPISEGSSITIGVNTGQPLSSLTIMGSPAPNFTRTIVVPSADFDATAIATGITGFVSNCAPKHVYVKPKAISCRFADGAYTYKEKMDLPYNNPFYGDYSLSQVWVGLGMQDLRPAFYRNVPNAGPTSSTRVSFIANWLVPEDCWDWQLNTPNDTRCFMYMKNGNIREGSPIYLIRIFDMYDTACTAEVLGMRGLPGHGGCFAPETKIFMADGSYIDAADVRQHMRVWNPVLRQAQTVRSVIRGPEKPALFVVRTENHELRVTQHHPFKIERGLVSAADLRVGDVLQGGHGEAETILEIRREKLSKEKMVWNFELDSDSDRDEEHFVLADGIVTGDLYLQHKLEGPKKAKGRRAH